MVRRKISRKTPVVLKAAIALVIAAIITSLVILIKLYTNIFSPVIIPTDENSSLFYIPTGSDYQQVLNNLYSEGYILNKESFDWLAKKKKYPGNIKPGRYRLVNDMNNNELINLLRSGRQEPVRFVFNHLRTLDALAGVASQQLEPDSVVFSETFKSPSIAEKYNFTRETLPALFIPNTYELFWNTNVESFMERMTREYKAFWTKERIELAKQIGLDPVEVSILASIVEMESLHSEENPRIAGVYLNRLKRGMPLQSDPTIIFAHKNYSIRRVLNKHKTINSLYNTYKYSGLPPGPICIPSINAIDAVLKSEKHNYLFFCAKEDFSGYHNFAQTLSQHNRYARLYQQALNRARIFN